MHCLRVIHSRHSTPVSASSHFLLTPVTLVLCGHDIYVASTQSNVRYAQHRLKSLIIQNSTSINSAAAVKDTGPLSLHCAGHLIVHKKQCSQFTAKQSNGPLKHFCHQFESFKSSGQGQDGENLVCFSRFELKDPAVRKYDI